MTVAFRERFDDSRVGVVKPCRQHEQFEFSTLQRPLDSSCPDCQTMRSVVLGEQFDESFPGEVLTAEVSPEFNNLQIRVRLE